MSREPGFQSLGLLGLGLEALSLGLEEASLINKLGNTG